MLSRAKMGAILIASATLLAFGEYMNIDTATKRKDICRFLNDRAACVNADRSDSRSLEEIIGVLNGNWSFARTNAAVVLGNLGQKAKPAIPDLIRALNCGDGFVEREAAIALGKVSRGMPDTVDGLSQKLSSDWDVSIFSAEALGEIGAPAIVAIPALKAVVATPGYRRRLAEVASRSIRKLERLQTDHNTL